VIVSDAKKGLSIGWRAGYYDIQKANKEPMMRIDPNRSPDPWVWHALGSRPAPPRVLGIRAKSTLQAFAMVVSGGVVYHVLDHGIVAVFIGSFAFLVLAGGWCYPPLFEILALGGRRLAHGVALFLSWGLLAPFFYLCFVPGRLLLKARGLDPMNRAFPDRATSFWVPRKPVADLTQYRRQH